MTITFNLRHSTEIDADQIERIVTEKLQSLNVDFETKWTTFGLPFLTERGKLVDACIDAIKSETGIEAKLSTSGGTSDGRFIAPTGTQVVELGPVNATIHKVNECVSAEAPGQLSKIYQKILANVLAKT